MTDPTPLHSYMIRYRHKGEVIDVPATGDTPEDAYDRYMGRLKYWGKDAKDYKFISARLTDVLGKTSPR